MRAMILCALVVGLSLVSGCGSDDGQTEPCSLTGKKTIQYQVASSSDAGCPAIPDQQMDFDKEDGDMDGCTGAVDEETCTAYFDCVDEDGVEGTINFNIQNEKLTGTMKIEIPIGDEGEYVECTYLISTK